MIGEVISPFDNIATGATSQLDIFAVIVAVGDHGSIWGAIKIDSED
jgi:hypothetical protein